MAKDFIRLSLDFLALETNLLTQSNNACELHVTHESSPSTHLTHMRVHVKVHMCNT